MSMGRTALWVAVVVGIVPAAAAATDPSRSMCLFLVERERSDRDDLALEVDLARSRLSAAQQIFDLLDGLWGEQAVERLLWLAGRHERDVARLEQSLAQQRLARQEAVVDQYAAYCAALVEGDAGKARGEALQERFTDYRRAECDGLATRAEIASVDLDYQKEWRASILDLRENNVATRQDVIRAERDVEMADRRLAALRARAASCRRELPSVPEVSGKP